MTQGIDIRQSNDVIIRAFLTDADGELVTTGSTELEIYEVQDNGTLKIYDSGSDSFLSAPFSVATNAMVHRSFLSGDTGIWTYDASAVPFVAGKVYITKITHSDAAPQCREFQVGIADGSFDPFSDQVETDTAAIKAKTDQLAFTVANQVDANALSGGGGGDATEANQDAIIAKLNQTPVQVIGQLINGDCLQLVKNKDYEASNSNAITFTVEGVTGLATADDAKLTITSKDTGVKEIDRVASTSIDSANGVITFELDSAKLDYEPGDSYRYMVELRHSSDYQATIIGNHKLIDDIAE